MRVLVGCRTTTERNARGKGLALFEDDQECATWTPRHVLALVNPSFQVVNRTCRTAYSVHGDLGEVSVIDVAAGSEPRLLQQVETGGRNPVHLCLSCDERHLLVANYATGSLACFGVDSDGLLGERTSLIHFTGTPGPRARDQHGSHPHQVVNWPGTNLFLVPDKGLDRLHVVRLADNGVLHEVSSHAAPPGAGPRHLAVDLQRQSIWLVHELSSEVARLVFDPTMGVLTSTSPLSVLPPDFGGENSAAGIALHPHGQTLYVSNRGHDSVCVLQISADGEASAHRWLPSLGKTPRFITLSPCAKALVVANEDSDLVVRFPLDAAGTPGTGSVIAKTGSPVCLTFLPQDSQGLPS